MIVKHPNTLAVVLAGGEGRRLTPLTRFRSKPSMPFAGKYRLIDFVLSNLVHSGMLRMMVLTQYQSYSLLRHLSRGWRFMAHFDQYCDVIPAMTGEGQGWYAGSADALYRNLERIERERPGLVAVFGADHIYRMDVRQMIDEHNEVGADISVSVRPFPIEQAHQFGCIRVDESMRVVEFLEKPANPPPMPGDPTRALVSMGNYLFEGAVMREVLTADHDNPASKHDIGGDILPHWYDRLHIHAYDFERNVVPGGSDAERGYWRDVGTVLSYWQASMDLVSVTPAFNLYNREWPILTSRADLPPTKFVFADLESNRVGVATDSLVSDGCVISGSRIDRCVLSPSVRVNSYASVSESILFNAVDIGRHCRIRRAIIDKGVRVPPGTVIGEDDEADRANGLRVAEDGIRIVPIGAFGSTR